jgi:hypothetical protein
MSRYKNETLYEKTMRRIKNNPIVVAILTIGAIAVAVSQGLDMFNNLKQTVSPAEPSVPQISEVQITIQPYDVVTGYTDPAAILSLAPEGEAEIDAIAEAILEQISGAIQPGAESGFRANLEIEDDILSADKPLQGGVIVMNSVTQVAARVEIPDLAQGTDLTSIFSDSATYDAECSCIHMELHVATGGFQDEMLDIHQVANGYSFKPSSPSTSITLDFSVITTSILIETPKGEGADEAVLGALEARLNNSLRQQASGPKNLQLSPYQSLGELRAIIDPLIPSIAPGGGKGNVLEQYRVDFIVSVNFIVK